MRPSGQGRRRLSRGIVTALLSGGETAVDPSSTPLPADAEFTHTAPGVRDKTGEVSLESRSKRGVGRAQITLDTDQPKAYTIFRWRPAGQRSRL